MNIPKQVHESLTIRERPQLKSYPNAQRLQLAVQGRALHADEFRRPRDIAGEPADLGDQIIAFENFPRLAEREAP